MKNIFYLSMIALTWLTSPEHLRSAEMAMHHIAGSTEYKSAETLPRWAEHLEAEYGIRSTFTVAPDKAKTAPGLEQLAEADLLVVYARRLELPEDQTEKIRDWIASGKPVLGLRTASHAFQSWLEFDQEILGGDYSGHGEGEKDVQVRIAEAQGDHPILEGVEPWTREGKLYRNPNLAEDVTVLLHAKGSKETVPLAWVREIDGQRVFYTSLGFPADFENPTFVRLLDNAVFWLLKQELESP